MTKYTFPTNNLCDGFALFWVLRRKMPQPTVNPISPRRTGYISQLGDMGVACVRYGCHMCEIWVSWEKDMGAYSFTTLSENVFPSSKVTFIRYCPAERPCIFTFSKPCFWVCTSRPCMS